MIGWHHRLDGHEFEHAPGGGEGQGSLACCSPWGHKESNTTEPLNNNLDSRESASLRLPFPAFSGEVDTSERRSPRSCHRARGVLLMTVSIALAERDRRQTSELASE